MATSFKDVGKEDVRALKDAVEKIKHQRAEFLRKREFLKSTWSKFQKIVNLELRLFTRFSALSVWE